MEKCLIGPPDLDVSSIFFSVISLIAFVYICACAQIKISLIILIFSLSTYLYKYWSQYFTFQILVSMLPIINPYIEHEFFIQYYFNNLNPEAMYIG